MTQTIVAATDVVRVTPPNASYMYQQHYAEVFSYVRTRVGSHSDAEDLTSDVFCKAVAGLKTYRMMRSSPLPWLYTIAAHRVADYYRASRPTAEIDEAVQIPDTGPSPADVVVTREQVRGVWELSKTLPASQRRALWLRYGEELELKEIAAQMGRSVEAIKLLVHRAIRGIRANMSATEGTVPLLLLASTCSSVDRKGRRGGKRRPVGVDTSAVAA
ncbi:MAG: RNA polymerase sigma factor [Candidatus Dormibacteria bacterium]|jgi:RNA polymerase sigma-70 factor (ECF subfamily)